MRVKEKKAKTHFEFSSPAAMPLRITVEKMMTIVVSINSSLVPTIQTRNKGGQFSLRYELFKEVKRIKKLSNKAKERFSPNLSGDLFVYTAMTTMSTRTVWTPHSVLLEIPERSFIRYRHGVGNRTPQSSDPEHSLQFED